MRQLIPARSCSVSLGYLVLCCVVYVHGAGSSVRRSSSNTHLRLKLLQVTRRQALRGVVVGVAQQQPVAVVVPTVQQLVHLEALRYAEALRELGRGERTGDALRVLSPVRLTRRMSTHTHSSPLAGSMA